MRLGIEYRIEDARRSSHIPLNCPDVAHRGVVVGGNHLWWGGQAGAAVFAAAVAAVAAFVAAAAAAAVVTLFLSSVLRSKVSALLSSSVGVMGVEWAALVRVQFGGKAEVNLHRLRQLLGRM